VQTVDLITPVVDDPVTFGMIAAANSLSDVWAMGGKPLTALNILCFPSGTLPIEVAAGILKGGYQKIREAGAVLAGGHSVKDDELKYGLSVTGTIHPGRILANRTARPGNAIILTKALGTGIVATAVKGGVALPADGAAMAESAARLNRDAAEAMEGFPVDACTDITGFGLAGHLLEVARASRVAIEIDLAALPLLPGVAGYVAGGMVPGGTGANRRYAEGSIAMPAGERAAMEPVVFDPQTSGGLAIFLPAKDAPALLDELHRRGVTISRLIGRVTGEESCGRITFG
jgi:selenide,water dikinase